MNASLAHPEEWLWISKEQAEDLVSQSFWPFQNVSMDQMYNLTHMLNVNKNLHSIVKIIGSTIPSFGIISSLLLIGTCWRKSIKERNPFFAAMMLIAILDLIFNILDTIFNLCYRTWKNSGFWSPGLMWVIASFRGTAYSTSLASDICALLATLERYLAISKPHFYKNLPEPVKTVAWTCVICGTILLSLTRLHYTLAMQVELAGNLYIYTQSTLGRTEFVVGLATFSDAIVPITLVILTVALSTKFRMTVIQWQKNRYPKISRNIVVPSGYASGQEAQTPTAQSNKEDSAEFSSVITLTYLLDAFLILDNLGYCLYFVAELMLAQVHLEYDITYEDLVYVCEIYRFEAHASLIAVAVECLTRSVNLPVYLAFSGTIRSEFMDLCRRMFRF